MKVQFVDKVFRLLFIFIFVLGTAWTPVASEQAQPSLEHSCTGLIG